MKKLDELINELGNAIPYYEWVAPSISKGSVGWHIEHTLLTLNLIIDTVQRSNPQKYKWTFNFKRILVHALGKIPRGKAKAPASVQPTVQYNFDTLQQHLSLSRKKLKNLEHLQPNHYFTHPFFGDLNLRSTIRFLQIHTTHHLAIINDIIKSKK